MKKISSIIRNRLGAFHQIIINRLLSQTKIVFHNANKMEFYTPNALNNYRVRTFATKEPKTLKWIDGFEENAVFWDVGANIGLYSIYSAKSKNCQVFAFEPSVFNLEFLAKNIYINELQQLITIVPIALSDKKSLNLFKMNNPVWGGALSAFGVNFDQHGNVFNTSFEYSIPGLSADEVVKVFDIPKPDYIKIDVDGIEHLILSGAYDILQTVKSVLVEIDDDCSDQSDGASLYLSQAGLTLSEKHTFDFSNQSNQLWVNK